MADGRHPAYENRAHFYGIASRLMRQILVDSARARAARKRGAGLEVAVTSLPDRTPEPNRSVLALDDALQRLEEIDPLKGRLIEMRYFCGLNADESAAALELPSTKYGASCASRSHCFARRCPRRRSFDVICFLKKQGSYSCLHGPSFFFCSYPLTAGR